MSQHGEELLCSTCVKRTDHNYLPHGSGPPSRVCTICGSFYKSPELREALAKNAEAQFGRADTELDELNARLAAAPSEMGGIPTHFRDADGQVHLRGNPTQITRADAKDVVDFAASHDVCGHCRHFDLESGRREIQRQGLARALVQDYDWQIRHLGSSINELGLCGASGGKTMTGHGCRACEQFRSRA